MRLKDFTELTPNYVGHPINGDVSFVPMESLRNGEIDLKEIPFSQAAGKYTFFENGDLLIAKVTPCFENGNIAIAKNLTQGIGFGSSEIFVLRVNDKKALNTYMFYVSEAEDFQDKACATMHGVGGLKRIDPLFMRTYEFNLPSLDVQQRIVSYLDDKTAKIDKAVSLLQKKRDAYTRLKSSIINRAVTRGLNPNVELKDSGVEWIGMIPENWEVKRIKDIAKGIGSGTTPSSNTLRYYDSEDYLWINTGDFNNSEVYKGKQMISQAAIDEIKTLRFYPIDTILIAMYGASIGKVGILKSVATVNQACCAIVANKNFVLPYYLFYLLINNKDYLLRKSFGGTQPNVSQAIISNMLLPFPPINEQQAIVSYLDTQCSRIDHAISIIDKQIDAYTRLKKSLINEVVTGKRKC